MVPCDNDLNRVRLSTEPGYASAEFGRGPGLSEIACVDEDVAFWELWLAVMSVGNTDHRNWLCERGRWDSLIPGVKLPREKNARLSYELLPKSRSWAIKKFIQAGRPVKQGHFSTWLNKQKVSR